MIELSVIIPCFNNGVLLKEMLYCCVNQTYDNWEVIVVDDGSTDDTQAVVQQYAEADARIKLYVRDRSPKGSVVCRNIGLEKASGKYIMQLDADDLISLTCFEKRVAFMEEHPDCDYASFPAVSFRDPANIPSWGSKGVVRYGVCKGSNELLYYFLSANYPFSVWCNIYRKESISEIRWDEKVKIYTDFSYIVPMILQGKKNLFSGQEEYDYYYRRVSDGSNMCASFISDEKCDSTVYLFDKILGELRNRQDWECCRKYFLGLLLLHFERLLESGKIVKIKEYVEMLTKYYDRSVMKRFERVFKSLYEKHTIDSQVTATKMYTSLFFHFFRKRHLIFLLSSIKHRR